MEWINIVISRTLDCAKAGALLLLCLCSAGAQTGPNQISPKAAPKKFALVIGIDKYEIAPLFGCVKDAETFRDALINYGGFRRENIDMLADEAATYKAILKALVIGARKRSQATYSSSTFQAMARSFRTNNPPTSTRRPKSNRLI